ncbi:MAG: ComEC family competence protein [Bacteroidales bacterium]|nr:ComEC family competence protein [Bacteroidales bacterium]
MEFSETLKKLPFVRLIFPLFFGIISSLGFEITNRANVILITLPLAFILIIFLYPAEKKINAGWLRGILIQLCLFFLGIWLVQVKTVNVPDKKLLEEKSLVLKGIITDTPEIKARSVKTRIRIDETLRDEVFEKQKFNALIYFRLDSISTGLNYGDEVLLETSISEIAPPYNPEEFNYKKYLFRRNIFVSGFVDSGNWSILATNEGNPVKSLSLSARNSILKIYSAAGLANQELAVLSALTLGYKDSLSIETKKSFAASGAIHVLAVSGLHVGILYIILNLALGFLNKKRSGKIIKLVCILIMLWCYALITGLPPSVVRATLMFSFIQIGLSINREVNIYNSIAASAFILLVINPFIIFEVGFQLSYLAVLSIVTFYRRFYNLLVFKNWIPDKIWSLICVSVAAQVGTFPLTIFYFKQFPLYFWLSGIIVVPLVTIILYLAVLLIVLSPLNIIHSQLNAALNFLLKIILETVQKVELFPASVIQGIYFSAFEVCILYILILTITFFLFFKRTKYLIFSGIVILIFFSIGLFKDYNILHRREVVVYALPGNIAISFIEEGTNVVITDLPENTRENQLNYYCKNHWIKQGVFNHTLVVPVSYIKATDEKAYRYGNLYVSSLNNNVALNFYGKSFLILKEELKRNSSEELAFGNILFDSNTAPEILNALKGIKFERLIINDSKLIKNSWLKQSHQTSIYNLREQGAFINKINL